MPTESKHPETIVLHAGYRSDPATNAVAVPIYQTTSYQFHRHRARRQPVRAQGARQHLHPHHEPDQRRAGAARRRSSKAASRRWRSGRARRPRCSAVNNIAQAGDNFVASTDLYGGTWNLFLHTMQRTMGIEVRFVDPSRPGEFPPRHRRQDALLLRRDAAQPEARSVPDRRGRQDRPRAGRAADHGQHRRAGDLPAARPRRRDRHALDDQVHRRPRHLDRRHRRRRRQFRLGEACRPLPAAEPARPGLSRRGVDPGGQADGPGRLHHQDAGDPAARPRRGGEPVQLLPAHPGAGDPAAAHARALRQRDGGRASACRSHAEGQQGDPSEPDDRRSRGAAPMPI